MQPKRSNRAHIVRKILENVPPYHFSPRKFQFDLLDAAAERNVIICKDNNVPPIFIILSLQKQFALRHSSKSVLILASGAVISDWARTFSRNIGKEVLVVTSYSPIDTSALLSSSVILMTPECAKKLCCRSEPNKPPAFCIPEHVYLLVVDECQFVLKTDHPYLALFGPNGLGHFSNVDELYVEEVWSRRESYYGQFSLSKPMVSSSSASSDFRLLAFASSILPADCADPVAAKEHICELEYRLNCRLETASDFINLLALGFRPREEVLPAFLSHSLPKFASLVLRILEEMGEFLGDVDVDSDMMPDGRGRLINVLSYCRRAVSQCETIVHQLGVWCGCLIARVFLKHLLRLEHCRAAILKEEKEVSVPEHAEDLLTRLLRYTATQLALIVRTFQTVTEKCMTLEEMRSLASPRVLQLVDQLKPLKPDMNFRIEVCEAPLNGSEVGLGLPGFTVRDKVGRRKSRGQSTASSRAPSPASSLSSPDSFSDLSSESDGNSTGFGSNISLEDLSGSKSKRSHRCSMESGLGLGDNSRLIYRAVPTASSPERASGVPGQPQQQKLCGLVLVACQFSAYALSRYIEELCSWDEDLFFVKAGHLFPCQSQGAGFKQDSNTPDPFGCGGGSILPASHEETVAEFRRGGNVNLLITTQAAGLGTELPRCNIVACLQPPETLSSYLASKAYLQLVSSSARLLHFVGDDDESAKLINSFQEIEHLLVQRCHSYNLFSDEHEVSMDIANEKLPTSLEKVQPSKAVNSINHYCARLPSDFLTHLPPRWHIVQSTAAKELPEETDLASITCGHLSECPPRPDMPVYRCDLRLPMNAPIKTTIRGDWMGCKKLAKMSAALKGLQVLQSEGEVDHQGHKHNPKITSSCIFGTFGVSPSSLGNLPKHRQSYFKKTPDILLGCQPSEDVEGNINFLFFIDSLREGKNEAVNPQPETDLGFGILTTKPFYHVPEFPIFSRAGEESVRLIEFWSPDGSTEPNRLPRKSKPLSSHQLDLLTRFHRLVFQTVLRFEKDALLEFDLSKAYSSILIVPIRRDTYDIDWNFVDLVLNSFSSEISDCRLPPRLKPAPIVSPTAIPLLSSALSPEKASVKRPPVKKSANLIFEFQAEDFEDTVVMPAYRKLDVPPHYYVAKIRYDLSPLSDFPSKQFATFADYYTNKYQVKLTTLDQPLLDVDFTDLRLCLIVPRYLNSQGASLHLGSSSNATVKQDHPANVRHKQLLIPELCHRHAFSASIWRKAVCLPSIIYRLHHLLLGEELRQLIAVETGLGCPVPPPPKLDGGDIVREDLTATSIFSPLRFIFPVEVPKFHNSGDGGVGGESGAKRSKKRRKKCSSKENGDDGDKEDGGEDGDDNEEMEEEPKSVHLRLSPGKAVEAPDPAAELADLLKETKIVSETEALITDAMEQQMLNGASTALNDDDEADSFKPVPNVTNVDNEYFETASDVESVDSFEGNVVFFPSDDDDESDLEDVLGPDDVVVRLNNSSRDFKPGPASILHALTMSCANDFINLERLETIGDSLLKFVVSLFLYLKMPKSLEGRLSELRSRIVSNSHLFQLGRRKLLPERMVGIKFEPHDTWVPPGYLYPSNIQESRPRFSPPCPEQTVKIDTFDPNAPEVLEAKEAIKCLVRVQQFIVDKSVADCVEALIGCYLMERGERSALKLLRWFGIDCLPPSDMMKRHGPPWSLAAYPDSVPRFDSSNEAFVRQAYMAEGFPRLEETIGYQFKNPNLLLHAFTHLSYHQMDYWNDEHSEFADIECYQRLEFLGDAVLDYVITRFLFEDSQNHTPGVLTDLRSALVNNNIFAALAVRIGLHRYLRFSSPHLFRGIDAFVRFQKEVAKDDLDYINNETNEDAVAENNAGGTKTSDEVEIPKTLADIFESLAAAVFVDSDLCLNTVWRVFYPLIRERVERYTACIPKSPVRELFEREPDIVKFERPRHTAEGRIRVCAHVVGKGKFYGVGRSYRLAKSLAAKRALRVLHNYSA